MEHGLDQAGQGAGTCECSNEPTGSIIVGNFLTSWELASFSRSCAPWSK